MTTVAVTKVLSIGMGGFDTLAMADRYFGNGDIAALNSKLHESTAYNVFQTGVTALAIFTGGMTTSMKCFVAGTMILTAEGLVAIENIKAGDMVLSRNPETGEISYKKVEISFVNQANKLAHVTVNGETIVSTHDHPYYVKNRGFVNACDLWIGAELIDRKGVIHPVEQIYRENLSEDSVNVYNFKVEDYHTYFVGNNSVLVHNANCRLIQNADGSYDAELSYKEDWTPEQRAQADAKCKALTEADTYKTEVANKRSSKSNSIFRKDNHIPSYQDVDHIQDLQLNGTDSALNKWGLDRSVNRSLGKQINILIKNLPLKTIIKNFRMI